MVINSFSKKLTRKDYLGDPFKIAKNILLGSYLCTKMGSKLTVGKITELEVYIGGEDKAAHTYNYRRTKRTEINYREGGYVYIFKVYGLHDQFCVTLGKSDEPTAILIRAVEPVCGIEIMERRRGMKNLLQLTTGPSKVCQALGIETKKHYGTDLLGDTIWISPRQEKISPRKIKSATRVGIDYAEEYKDKLWRFHLDSKFVSK